MKSNVAAGRKRPRGVFEDAVVEVTNTILTKVKKRILATKKKDITSVGDGKRPRKKVRRNAPYTVANRDPPKSATFLGLPAELRLMIYGYLFSTKSAKDVLTAASGVHCCNKPEYPPPSPSPESPRRTRYGGNIAYAPGTFINRHRFCTCSGTAQHDILTVSKQIYREALPVFHDSIEFRLNLPFWGSDGQSDTLSDMERDISPESRKHIKNLLLVGDDGDDYSYDPDDTPEYWRRLGELLPEVINVRLHFDVTSDFDVTSYVDAENLLDMFEGLVTLPKLGFVVLEISECAYEDEYEDTADPIHGVNARKSLTAILQDEAKKSGKKIEIIEA